MFEGFEQRIVSTNGNTVFVQSAGRGLPVLLLHGFPQTHLMWRDVAQQLSGHFKVVCPDLRGYGRSGCPDSTSDHAPYSKRSMGDELVAVMKQLGHPCFYVAGHDRGGRVAYRMALDHPQAVTKVAVLDVLPTLTAWDRADARLALAFWPWSLLAQPEPLPERLLTADPQAVIDNALSDWGTPANTFDAQVRSAYVDALRDPGHVHAICEEYRAAATIDRVHDAADRDAGKRIARPLLALWSAEGGLQNWYEAEGGPLALWQQWAIDVQGRAMRGGHFFPVELPVETAEALRDFFG